MEVPSAPKTVTLTNPNSVALSVTSVVPSGDYTVTNDTCSGTQVAGERHLHLRCDIHSVSDGDQERKHHRHRQCDPIDANIIVSGVGIIVTPTVSPKSLSYGKVQVNTVSPPQTVTLSNSNAVAVTFTSIATSGHMR